jgi:hypothetical protein
MGMLGNNSKDEDAWLASALRHSHYELKNK